MDQPARPFARKYVRHSPGQHRSPSRNPLGFRFRRRSKRTEVLPHALSKFLALFRRHPSPTFRHPRPPGRSPGLLGDIIPRHRPSFDEGDRHHRCCKTLSLSVKFQSPQADRNRMIGLSAPAVVLFAGVLLAGGVALVLDATRRFWKR